MLSLTGVTSCGSVRQCPITKETTKIVYASHENSGIASQTRYEIVADSLIWELTEPRYGRHLRDVAKVERTEFETLVDLLSQIKFSAKDQHDTSSGGSGWGCGFENEQGLYLSFNNTYKLSGDYEEVIRLILSFADHHKPKGLKLYEEVKSQPHEQGQFGDFDQFPESLERFSVK